MRSDEWFGYIQDGHVWLFVCWKSEHTEAGQLPMLRGVVVIIAISCWDMPGPVVAVAIPYVYLSIVYPTGLCA